MVGRTRRFAAIATVAAGWIATGAAGPPAVHAAELQRQADSVRPAPAKASADRGKLFADGCMVLQQQMRWPGCAYGRKQSNRRVVLLGDSQAMQWFPALRRLALERGWRLVARIRAGCPPAAVDFSFRCDRWRGEALRRIERHDRPKLVVVGSGVAYGVVHGGRRLSTKASAPHMRKGYARTLRRLRRTGARVAVMKAQVWAPGSPVRCVAKRMRRLRKCAFARQQPTTRVFDAKAAKRVRGAKLIDPRPRLCLAKICPAVIDDMLVYRDPKHLSATFARSLAPWLGARLPRAR